MSRRIGRHVRHLTLKVPLPSGRTVITALAALAAGAVTYLEQRYGATLVAMVVTAAALGRHGQ